MLEFVKESRERTITLENTVQTHGKTIRNMERFKKKKLDEQFSKLLGIFKKLHINIPFLEALEQMPNYVKFMQDILSKKNGFKKYEMIGLTEECSVVLQKKLPQKLKDSWSFTIPCTIGSLIVSRALMLNVEDVQPTTISLHLPNRYLTYPKSLVEDVLVKRALIDAQKGGLALRVNDEKVAFNIYRSLKHHDEVSSCNMINVIDRTVEEHANVLLARDI
ncbi:uncharacterized protein LOC120089107 [Benincasa hispida]|uniref:uncharacterized protein LOC120089107 n=1 Tax=Benincasa hispida TaxID=102211 RepID=UPI0018FFE4AA|nr:uncharacterized protein LOC120089107 [Benincasa hispida]